MFEDSAPLTEFGLTSSVTTAKGVIIAQYTRHRKPPRAAALPEHDHVRPQLRFLRPVRPQTSVTSVSIQTGSAPGGMANTSPPIVP
jgi:hypothetical protein